MAGEIATTNIHPEATTAQHEVKAGAITICCSPSGVTGAGGCRSPFFQHWTAIHLCRFPVPGDSISFCLCTPLSTHVSGSYEKQHNSIELN